MKKTRIVICCVLAFLLAGNIFQIVSNSIRCDRRYTGRLPVVAVPSEETALAIVDTVLLATYGNDVLSEKPFFVRFDKAGERWIVAGKLPDEYFGGIFEIVIGQSDATIWSNTSVLFTDAVPNEEVAVSIASSVLSAKYGDGVFSMRPFSVDFNESENLWIVSGVLPDDYYDAVVQVAIRKSDAKIWDSTRLFSVDAVPDRSTALAIAQAVLIGINQSTDEIERTTFEVSYSEPIKAWVVTGSMPNGYLGGVSEIVVRKSDAMVLKIYLGV